MNNLIYDPHTEIFKALAHPVRCAIIDLLHDSERCVCYMETFLGLRQAYLSQQLHVLREAGLITHRRDGWNVYYRLADESVFELLIIAEKLTGITTSDQQMSKNMGEHKPGCIQKELA